MAKLIIILPFIILYKTSFSQNINNDIIGIKDNILVFHDTKNKTTQKIYYIEDKNVWKINSAFFKENKYIIKLYNYKEFLNFGLTGEINEVELTFTNELVLIKLDRTVVKLKEDKMFIYTMIDSSRVVQIDTLNDILIYNRYFPKMKHYIANGNIFHNSDNEHKILLEKWTNKNIECGYYELDCFGDLLIITKQCRKFANKKNITVPELVLYELNSNKMIELNISGSNPRFSNDGRFFLYLSEFDYYIFDISRKSVNQLPRFDNATWIQ